MRLIRLTEYDSSDPENVSSTVLVNPAHIMYLREIQNGDRRYTFVRLSQDRQLVVGESPDEIQAMVQPVWRADTAIVIPLEDDS